MELGIALQRRRPAQGGFFMSLTDDRFSEKRSSIGDQDRNAINELASPRTTGAGVEIGLAAEGPESEHGCDTGGHPDDGRRSAVAHEAATD